MSGNEDRRRIVAALREDIDEDTFKRVTISESLCEVLDIDIEIDEYYGTRLHQEAEEVEVCRTLADLIDRPTCRMVVDDRSTWIVRCTNCGRRFEQEDVWVHGPWKFCPKCGAEMVE